MGMKLLLSILALISGQNYLDMRNHSYREMTEYLKLIKYTCPGKNFDIIYRTICCSFFDAPYAILDFCQLVFFFRVDVFYF